jgi:hypothetical protein
MKYFIMFFNTFKRNKNPDENLDLPMDFKVLTDFCQIFVTARKKSRNLGKKTVS